MALISFPRVFANLTTALMSYLDDNFNAINSVFGAATSSSATPGANVIPIAGTDGRLAAGWAGLINVQVITGGVTYTPTTGTHTIIIELIGGGGGGGGCPATGAGQVCIAQSGGAGGYARKLFTGIGAGPYTIAIGVGGAGGSNLGTNGQTAGNTTFTGPGAVTVTAGGGNGGGAGGAQTPPQMVIGAVGGVCTLGDINVTGQSGTLSIAVAAAAGGAVSGVGGATIFGRGGTPIGGAGQGNGSGGSGAALTQSSGGQGGGAGTGGIIVVWEFA